MASPVEADLRQPLAGIGIKVLQNDHSAAPVFVACASVHRSPRFTSRTACFLPEEIAEGIPSARQLTSSVSAHRRLLLPVKNLSLLDNAYKI
jgi:hypothetical protein